MFDEPFLTSLEDVRIRRIFEGIDEPIDFRRLDALQIIATGHVELEPIRAA